MKSSLKNMVLVLFCITLISGACVGLVNMITKGPIAKAKAEAEKRALAEVLPEFDKVEKKEFKVDGLQIAAYTALKGQDTVGYAINSASKKGFGGVITMMVGFDTHGTILNVKVLSQSETPGYGAEMVKPGNSLISSIKGKEASQIKLTIKKKNSGGDIEALSGATISSRAYADAVARAYSVFKYVAGWSDEIQATTGATQKNK